MDQGKRDKTGGNTIEMAFSKAVKNHVRPGEGNPIEGKFGKAKDSYANRSPKYFRLSL
tara:strand:- start:670 stop:843 length:174 start_codon:yes stop_codon:yes gene_type:complete